MHIDRIVIREIRLPLCEPFETAHGIVSDRRVILVQVWESDGAVGWGECVALEEPTYLPEVVDTAWTVLREWVAPLCVNGTFNAPQDVATALEKHIRGHGMAKAAVEMAMWDVAARLQAKPLSKLLGGTRDAVATGVAVGLQPSPKALVDKVQACIEAGYGRVKIKIQPGRDVAYIAAVRGRLGPDAPLMVDANSAYSLEDLETLKMLDEFQLMMIEQPLGWNDLMDHAVLQRELNTPICLDESIHSLHDARLMLKLGSGRIVNIKPGRVGGFFEAIAIHNFCAEHDVPVWCGGMLETGIGRAHNVALASLSNFTLPGDLSPSARYWQQDIVEPEWTMDHHGMVKVPLDRPGMGVAVDVDRIEKLTVRCETVE